MPLTNAMPVTSLNSRPRLLVTALDWGLGHATRCVPLIEAACELGAEVHLASDGRALEFWRGRFPQLPLHQLPGYHVRYSRGHRQWLAVLRQTPRLWQVIWAERRTTSDLVKRHRIQAIISDHRYGCHVEEIPSIFLAHQLALRLPPGMTQWQAGLARLHQRVLIPFSQIWVPDHFEGPGLSGDLSRAYPDPSALTYIGPLSHLAGVAPLAKENWPESLQTHTRPYVALLSGPEPQRRMFESKLNEQAAMSSAEWWIIRGIPGPLEVVRAGNVRLISFLDGALLVAVLQHARGILARSGYSTLMDFAALGVGPIGLVPTPGQTEQLYLARNWADQGWAQMLSQTDLCLAQDLMLPQYVPHIRQPQPHLLVRALQQLLSHVV